MLKFTTLTTAVAIAAGTGWISLGQPSYLHAEDASMKAEVKVDKDGMEKKEMSKSEKDLKGARKTLATLTEAALSDNAVQNVGERLSAADRERVLGENVDHAGLKQTVETLRNDWKAKYGSDFTIANANDTLNYTPANAKERNRVNRTAGADNRSPARIDAAPAGDQTTRGPGDVMSDMVSAVKPDATGDVGKPQGVPTQTAADPQARPSDSPRIIAADANNNTDNAQPAAGTVAPNENADSDKPSTIYYTIPAGEGANIDTLKLVNESGDWKVDIADSIDGNKLANNLDKHLKMVVNMKAEWPDDVNEAQRAVAHHVAAALNDTSN